MRRLIRAHSTNRKSKTENGGGRKSLLESLESRLLLSTYTPAQIRNAYGINAVNADGSGQTIAIIDAYNDNHIAADLNTFDQNFSTTSGGGGSTLYAQYGAASTFLTVDTLGTRTKSDAGWAMETALDIEWAHAIAPDAKIVLVQAHSDSLTDLLAAVNYAKSLSAVDVVSMSWGSNEFSGETSYDSTFTTPNGHKGITFVASSGDDGTGAGWPSIASNVLAVGGTTLNLSGNNYASESAWSDSGGGVSAYESTPSYQSAVDPYGHRANPDVAYNADPNTGYYVYDSNYYGQTGFFNVGGTSAGAPQWAALVALADQLRANAGMSSLTSAQTLSTLYALPASDFHDITTGSNGHAATTGYDLATGRGSPVANALVPALAGIVVPAKTVSNTNPQSTPQSNNPLLSRLHHNYTLVTYLSATPLPTFFPSTAATSPILSANIALASLPVTTSSTQSISLIVPATAEARLADDLLPPSTDEILPTIIPDVAPLDLAPAPFAQLQEDLADPNPAEKTT